MKAFLRDIVIPKYGRYRLKQMKHQIKMVFAKSSDSCDLYSFVTTIEDQFCTNDEYDWKVGIQDKLLEEKINYAKSCIGKTFEINLYDFTTRDLTANKYVAFKVMCSNCFETDYHIASYMAKEDVIMSLKYSLTMRGLQGYIEGILEDKSTEKITTELFFSEPIPEKKHFDIPYEKYFYLNDDYIVNVVSVEDIRVGRNLAYQIKDRTFCEVEFDGYVREIEVYRSKVRTAKKENESFKKRVFFWKPKVVVAELTLPPDVISFMKECIILGKEYSSDCKKADREYSDICEKRLRKKFLGEDSEEKEFKEKWLGYKKSIKEKYRNSSVIKVIN